MLSHPVTRGFVYVKLFGSILDSSVWIGTQPETKVVWITMLAMADEYGIVHAAVPGVAHRAGVTVVACEDALSILESPDPRSRSPQHDGRRIEKVDGGWLLLNYEKYREIRSRKQIADAVRQKRYRHGRDDA